MPSILNYRKVIAGILLSLPTALAHGQPSPIERAQHQVTEYIANLANLHCTESVTQEKLGENGHVETTERAQYDYLTMMSGTGDDFQLNESRIESSSNHHKGPRSSMMISNGLATVLLVFHPYYRDSFTFAAGNEELINGRKAVPVYFTHIFAIWPLPNDDANSFQRACGIFPRYFCETPEMISEVSSGYFWGQTRTGNFNLKELGAISARDWQVG